jgi:hypothetical protein
MATCVATFESAKAYSVWVVQSFVLQSCAVPCQDTPKSRLAARASRQDVVGVESVPVHTRCAGLGGHFGL